MFIIDLLLIVIGLAICFRGVYIQNVCKALLGAIQGLVWAVIIQMVLTALGIFSGIADIWLLFMIIIALGSAYLACAYERIYRAIQGILYGLITGGLIALVVSTVAVVSSFSSYDSNINSWLPITVCMIIIAFVIFGAIKSSFFRGLGNFLMIFIVCMLIMCAYMKMQYAAILALIIAVIGMFSLNALKKYIPILKISAMGACIAVVGAWLLFEDELLIDSLIDNASRLISNITGSGRGPRNEIALPLVIIGMLTCIGTYSQVKFLKKLSENGEFSVALIADRLKGYLGGIHSLLNTVAAILHSFTQNVRDFFARKRLALIRFAKISLIVVISVALLFGIVAVVKHALQAKKVKQGASSITYAGENFIDEINKAYGSTVVKYNRFYTGSSDGDQTGYEATLVNEFSGSLTVDCWYFDEDDEMLLDGISIYVEPFENGDVSAIANFYACVMQVFYNLDRYECEDIIRDELLYTDFSIPYNRAEITLGNASNIYMVMGLNDNGYGDIMWYMHAGEYY